MLELHSRQVHPRVSATFGERCGIGAGSAPDLQDVATHRQHGEDPSEELGSIAARTLHPPPVGVIEIVVPLLDDALRIDGVHVRGSASGSRVPMAGSNAAAFAFVSTSSASGSESATTPAPDWTCARPSATTAVRIVMQKSRSPAKVR